MVEQRSCYSEFTFTCMYKYMVTACNHGNQNMPYKKALNETKLSKMCCTALLDWTTEVKS